MTVRCAEEADAAALLRLIARLGDEPKFSVFERDEFTVTVERQREKIREFLEAPGCLMLVAEENGTLVGEINFHSPERRRLRHRGEVGLSVAQEWRGRGVGRVMLEAVIGWCTAHPVIEKINLKVFAINERAIALYRSLGFAEEGRRVREIRLPSGQFSDDILMALFVKKSESTPRCQ